MLCSLFSWDFFFYFLFFFLQKAASFSHLLFSSSFACSFSSKMWRVFCQWSPACSELELLSWGSYSGLQCPWGVGERIHKTKLDKSGRSSAEGS